MPPDSPPDDPYAWPTDCDLWNMGMTRESSTPTERRKDPPPQPVKAKTGSLFG